MKIGDSMKISRSRTIKLTGIKDGICQLEFYDLSGKYLSMGKCKEDELDALVLAQLKDMKIEVKRAEARAKEIARLKEELGVE